MAFAGDDGSAFAVGSGFSVCTDGRSQLEHAKATAKAIVVATRWNAFLAFSENLERISPHCDTSSVRTVGVFAFMDHVANLPRERLGRERFLQQLETWIEHAVVSDIAVRVT